MSSSEALALQELLPSNGSEDAKRGPGTALNELTTPSEAGNKHDPSQKPTKSKTPQQQERLRLRQLRKRQIVRQEQWQRKQKEATKTPDDSSSHDSIEALSFPLRFRADVKWALADCPEHTIEDMELEFWKEDDAEISQKRPSQIDADEDSHAERVRSLAGELMDYDLGGSSTDPLILCFADELGRKDSFAVLEEVLQEERGSRSLYEDLIADLREQVSNYEGLVQGLEKKCALLEKKCAWEEEYGRSIRQIVDKFIKS